MRKALKHSLLLAVLLCCVGCDQATKSAARKLLATSEPITLLNDFIIFEYAENPGAFLSIGAGLPESLRILIFAVFAGALLAVMLALGLRERDMSLRQLMSLALVTGGGTGNLIDRVMNDGHVVDFVSVGVGSLRTGIFNVADVAIIAGATLLLIDLLRNKGRSSEAA